MRRCDRQAVEVPAPAVPGGDEHSDHPAFGFRDQQVVGADIDQLLERLDVVVAPGTAPASRHRSSTSTTSSLTAGRMRTMPRRADTSG
jgi:hypothetical protein